MRRTTCRYPRGELAVVVDCADLDRAARFWAAALDYVRAEPHGRYLPLIPASGPGVELLLQRVDDPARGKNRLHLDLRTRDLGAELDRLTALGARRLTDEPIVEEGWTWHVLLDPDDNEFCVLRPPENYWAD